MKSRWLDYAWLAIDVILIWVFVWVVSSCRGCDVAGVFYFCNDEGAHEIVQNPPAEWRARAVEVQRELYDYTRIHFPTDTTRFVWRDSSVLIFVRVLGHGIPGGAMRTNGDTVLFNAGEEAFVGGWRHEFVHWVQPLNDWLQQDDRGRHTIHYRPIFDYVRAPLISE